MYPGMHGHIHMHKTKDGRDVELGHGDVSYVVLVEWVGMGFRLAVPVVSGRSRDEILLHLGDYCSHFALLRLF
jgi:hypothetical protein